MADMKNAFSLKLLFCFLLQAATATVFAQQNPILGKFNVFESNGKVYLTWSIVSGSTCNDIQIYRSTDKINYTQVGGIPGVCGSIYNAVSYSFTDENPVKNKFNYYRLELGYSGSSQILSIEIIDFENNNYQIRPNPVIGNAKIYFDNNSKHTHQISIYNLNGAQVFSSSTNEDFFDLNTETFLSGMYVFTIASEGNAPKVTGRIVVQ